MEPGQVDRNLLRLLPLAARTHDMTLADVLPLTHRPPPLSSPPLEQVARRVVVARRNDRPVVIMLGAHVIKQGLSLFLIDLLDKGMVTHLAANGACAIHDFELALVGGTTESVARYLAEGQFGLWEETGRINDLVAQGAQAGLGFGAAMGKAIHEGAFPHRDVSVFAAAFRLGVPASVHIGIGQDIIHMHPNFDPQLTALASYCDFLSLAHTLLELEGGVFLNYGSAVTGPEVFQKALSMARNLAAQRGQTVERFSTAVFDLHDLGPEVDREPPPDDPRYYFRPYKTLLVRAISRGGESFYVRGDHRLTLPHLHRLLLQP
ncbi:MAG: hypothetical protein ACP5G2_04950 [Candidatus Bipolaricaulaceae bacterium]